MLLLELHARALQHDLERRAIDVRIFTQCRPERRTEGLSVDVHFALVHEAALRLVHEFHRIFDGDEQISTLTRSFGMIISRSLMAGAALYRSTGYALAMLSRVVRILCTTFCAAVCAVALCVPLAGASCAAVVGVGKPCDVDADCPGSTCAPDGFCVVNPPGEGEEMLAAPSAAAIEVRLMGNQASGDEDVAITSLQLFVRE